MIPMLQNNLSTLALRIFKKLFIKFNIGKCMVTYNNSSMSDIATYIIIIMKKLSGRYL